MALNAEKEREEVKDHSTTQSNHSARETLLHKVNPEILNGSKLCRQTNYLAMLSLHFFIDIILSQYITIVTIFFAMTFHH